MGYQERLGAGQGEVNFAYAATYLGCCSNPAWASDIWWENCACIKCDSAELFRSGDTHDSERETSHLWAEECPKYIQQLLSSRSFQLRHVGF